MTRRNELSYEQRRALRRMQDRGHVLLSDRPGEWDGAGRATCESLVRRGLARWTTVRLAGAGGMVHEWPAIVPTEQEATS